MFSAHVHTLAIYFSQLPFRVLLLILKEMPDRTSGLNRCWIRYIWREQDEFAEKIEIEGEVLRTPSKESLITF